MVWCWRRYAEQSKMNRRYSLWLSGDLMLLLFMAMVIYTFPLEPSIPYLQFTYSENAFKAVLEQWGSEGIEQFRRHFVIDFPFLVSYGIFGFLFSKNSPILSRQTTVIRSFMVWGLPVAASLDAVENLIHLHLIAGANEPHPHFILLQASWPAASGCLSQHLSLPRPISGIKPV
jgi:hypothetical protein